jgi:hypothetical protein
VPEQFERHITSHHITSHHITWRPESSTANQIEIKLADLPDRENESSSLQSSSVFSPDRATSCWNIYTHSHPSRSSHTAELPLSIMPLGRPVQPLIFVTQTDLGWTTDISPGSTRSTLPRMFTPPTTPSPTLRAGDPPMTPTKSSGRRPRTPLTRPPPSSLALKNVQRSSHTHSEASSSSRPHTAGADAHYSDVFGSRLDSPFQQQYDGEVVWIKNQKVDDEADLDGFRLATSPDPFKIGSREEIRASMEMEMPVL